MSIRPVQFHSVAGTFDVVHDDVNPPHTGTLHLTDVQFVDGPDANPRPDFMVVACPQAGCGAVSTHPVGGGAAPDMVQELFVRQVRRLGCPCGQLTANKPFALVIAHIKNHVVGQDGPGRWQAAANIS